MPRYAIYNSQRGIAFIIVLLFLQIGTIYGLYMLSSNTLLDKLNSMNWEKESAMISLNELLPALTENIQNESLSCSIAQADLSGFLSQPWLFHTCKGQLEQLQYEYVVEQLGEAPCATLQNMDMPHYSAHYFRITILAITKKSHIKILLQSTIINPLGRLEKCDGVQYPVNIGQQSWNAVS